MTEIGQIILDVLEDTGSLPIGCAEEVAELCEQKLVNASLEQVANILGGSVEIDNDGQAIIYTGVYRAS
jgi:hypothetical protein